MTFIVSLLLLASEHTANTVSSSVWDWWYSITAAFIVNCSVCLCFTTAMYLLTASIACSPVVSTRRHTIWSLPKRPIISLILECERIMLAHWHRHCISLSGLAQFICRATKDNGLWYLLWRSTSLKVSS